MKNIFYLVLISISIMSCSKVKSNRWIFFDLNIVNVDDSGPVTVELRLSYSTRNILGNWDGKVVSMGTVKNGNFTSEVKVPYDARNLVLSYFSQETVPASYYAAGYSEKWYSDLDFEIDNKKVNKFDIEINPLYQFNLGFKNINCFDYNDTLWITNDNYDKGNYFFVGCIDTVDVRYLPFITISDVLIIYLRTKRDNIESFEEKIYNLTTDINVLKIEY